MKAMKRDRAIEGDACGEIKRFRQSTIKIGPLYIFMVRER